MIERWIIYGLIATVALGAVWGKGYLMGSERLNDYIGKQAAEETRISAARERVTTNTVIRYVKVAGETKIVTQTIENEVIKYVESGLDSCPLSNRAVSLHDSAAAKQLPPSASPTDAAASGIETSALNKTCTENYAIYHETADRLRALQGWIREQEEVK